MNLRGEDSRRVADALSEKGVPLIYSTSNDSREMREIARHHAVLHKPFRETDLITALAELLSQMGGEMINEGTGRKEKARRTGITRV
jgi:spore germination protein YaaH